MRYGSDHKQILQRDTVLFKVGLFGWQLEDPRHIKNTLVWV